MLRAQLGSRCRRGRIMGQNSENQTPNSASGKTERGGARGAVKTALLIALCALLLPLLAVNLTLIIKGSVNPGVPPDIFGIAPLAVTADSMKGARDDSFSAGALLFVRLLDEEEKQALTAGDVVTFRSGEVFVTLRIAEVVRDGAGKTTAFRVIGDNDAAQENASPLDVSADNVMGVYAGSVPGLGGFSLFLQTPVGVLVFVGIPAVAYVLCDIARITVRSRRGRAAEDNAIREKDEEIARLRALVDARDALSPEEEGE